jgi:transposase
MTPAPLSIWSRVEAGVLTSSCRDRKVQRSVDRAVYRQSNLIERFLNKLKHFPRIATHYDKTARNFLASVLIASTRLWVKFESTT